MAEKDYSHRDITDKLGLKPGQAVKVWGNGDPDLLQAGARKNWPGFVKTGLADVVLYWPKTAGEITPTLVELRQAIVAERRHLGDDRQARPTERQRHGLLNQTDLIPLGKAAGLVDNKTCSVSDAESGMRFVIRVKDRKEGLLGLRIVWPRGILPLYPLYA